MFVRKNAEDNMCLQTMFSQRILLEFFNIYKSSLITSQGCNKLKNQLNNLFTS